ncbi:hypothetical protein J3R82DRAFT_9742 [Butyriboletus roseoflavus]|nr:hypothetical protein J3R82DRAFT_9742 [Butyriboletus roseoflavus]
MQSNTNAEQDTQLLSVGQQCSESSCLLVDFLPFKCQHCSKNFCGEHFLVAAHHCPQYDESKHNRVAPSCPLCNTPVAIPLGEDPNIRMERHINTECSVITGKSGRTRSQPVCARGKCGKVLYAPIACNEAVLSPAPLPKGPQLLEPSVDCSFLFQVAWHVFMGRFQALRKDVRNAVIEHIQLSRQSSPFMVWNFDLFEYCRIEQALLKD